MVELRFKIEDRYLAGLSKLMGDRSSTELVRDALAMLKWGAEERRQGRYIVSADANGENAHRLVIPSLEIAHALGDTDETSP